VTALPAIYGYAICLCAPCDTRDYPSPDFTGSTLLLSLKTGRAAQQSWALGRRSDAVMGIARGNQSIAISQVVIVRLRRNTLKNLKMKRKSNIDVHLAVLFMKPQYIYLKILTMIYFLGNYNQP
jgi:hypothetical protein